jgi:hypothetical protein
LGPLSARHVLAVWRLPPVLMVDNPVIENLGGRPRGGLVASSCYRAPSLIIARVSAMTSAGVW